MTLVQAGVVDVAWAGVIGGLQGEGSGVAITSGLHTTNQHALSAGISSTHTNRGIHLAGTIHVVQEAPVVTPAVQVGNLVEAAAVGSRLGWRSGCCNGHGLSICCTGHAAVKTDGSIGRA